ncbi:hypothetical protein RUM44_012405 [Polyplax serrata]|uniref:Uncharacterized protein n=1 Tax=Polyplax serrata TaxID=468196 RepID=A0ABR1BB81_POLSC
MEREVRIESNCFNYNRGLFGDRLKTRLGTLGISESRLLCSGMQCGVPQKVPDEYTQTSNGFLPSTTTTKKINKKFLAQYRFEIPVGVART